MLDNQNMTKEEVCIKIVDLIKEHMTTDEGEIFKTFYLSKENANDDSLYFEFYPTGNIDYDEIRKNKGIIPQSKFGSDYNVPWKTPLGYDSNNGYSKDNRPFHIKLLDVLTRAFIKKEA